MAELTVRCQACGRQMVERRNAKTRGRFLACTGYAERDLEDNPRCTNTQPIPESVRMRERGAPVLPGF